MIKLTTYCYYSLELIKLGIQYITHKNVNININGENRQTTITETTVSSTDADSEEVINQTAVVVCLSDMQKDVRNEK